MEMTAFMPRQKDDDDDSVGQTQTSAALSSVSAKDLHDDAASTSKQGTASLLPAELPSSISKKRMMRPKSMSSLSALKSSSSDTDDGSFTTSTSQQQKSVFRKRLPNIHEESNQPSLASSMIAPTDRPSVSFALPTAVKRKKSKKAKRSSSSISTSNASKSPSNEPLVAPLPQEPLTHPNASLFQHPNLRSVPIMAHPGMIISSPPSFSTDSFNSTETQPAMLIYTDQGELVPMAIPFPMTLTSSHPGVAEYGRRRSWGPSPLRRCTSLPGLKVAGMVENEVAFRDDIETPITPLTTVNEMEDDEKPLSDVKDTHDDEKPLMIVKESVDDEKPLATIKPSPREVPRTLSLPPPLITRGAAFQKPSYLLRNSPPSPPPYPACLGRKNRREINLRRQLSAQSLKKALEKQQMSPRSPAKRMSSPPVMQVPHNTPAGSSAGDDEPLGLGLAITSVAVRATDAPPMFFLDSDGSSCSSDSEDSGKKRKAKRGKKLRFEETVKPGRKKIESKMEDGKLKKSKSALGLVTLPSHRRANSISSPTPTPPPSPTTDDTTTPLRVFFRWKRNPSDPDVPSAPSTTPSPTPAESSPRPSFMKRWSSVPHLAAPLPTPTDMERKSSRISWSFARRPPQLDIPTAPTTSTETPSTSTTFINPIFPHVKRPSSPSSTTSSSTLHDDLPTPIPPSPRSHTRNSSTSTATIVEPIDATILPLKTDEPQPVSLNISESLVDEEVKGKPVARDLIHPVARDVDEVFFGETGNQTPRTMKRRSMFGWRD
ncbi:hypothetical protein BC829DRAFT_399331 [Chytridium lagenaria]|nr:hypothetical protein BC829DRAFT_399331 [Chytridium lagenaria]